MTGSSCRILRGLAAGASLAVLLGACAGIKPAPVLPMDPIYEPDTMPQPSDAPLIESTPAPSAAPASGSAAEGQRSAPSPSPESTRGTSSATGVATGVANGPGGGSGVPAAGASPTGAAAQSTASQQASANGAGAANAPERVALAPTNVPSPLVGSEGAGPAAPGAAAAANAANAATETAEDAQLVRLLSDLERYGSYNGDELKRELASANAALARQRTDANRIRVGVLYSLARTSSQDDQRALQMFETVAKDAPAGSPMRHLAVILQTQVLERQRAVKYEQQKGDAAVQKLEALRAMEQSLFRDRVRGGGGGGGGAGGSGR